VIALDPAQIGGLTEAAVLEHCEKLYDKVLATEGTQLPSTGRHCGTDRFNVRARAAESGVTLPVALIAEVEQLIADPELVTNVYFPGGVQFP